MESRLRVMQNPGGRGSSAQRVGCQPRVWGVSPDGVEPRGEGGLAFITSWHSEFTLSQRIPFLFL